MLVVACAALSGPLAAVAEGVGDAAAQYVSGVRELETLLAEAAVRKRETAWLTDNRPGEPRASRPPFAELIQRSVNSAEESVHYTRRSAFQRGTD